MKNFIVSVRRYSGELKDNLTYQMSAEDEFDMLVTLLRGYGKIQADTQAEAKVKAAKLLDEWLDEGWPLKDFYKAGIGFWPDDTVCFTITSIREGEIRYIYMEDTESAAD